MKVTKYRTVLDLIYCYKIVFVVVDLNFSDFLKIQLGNCYRGPCVLTKLCYYSK